MLNDLVLYRGEVAKVIAITANGEVSLLVDGHIVARFVCAEELSPIPLTTEILERNGFVSDFLGDMFWESESTRFALQKGLDGRNRWWWEVCNSPFLPLNYVHELQHALKLCGIKKEIVL